MRIHELPGGDRVYHYQKSVVICFGGARTVLSTGPFNGGIRKDLDAVFNHDETAGAGMACTLRAETYGQHLKLVAAEDLGLDAGRCTGMGTAARMENLAVKSMTYEDFTVTALVTGGIEVNGGRIGDPAPWHDREGAAVEARPGTINIMLHIDANLADGTLPRALVTCTEAKTAALQELAASSRYSMGLATGSGTDGTIVVCNRESPVLLTDAGKHCKLGEYIGKTVKAAVKEALFLQSGLCARRQHDIIRRMERFGIDEQTLWNAYLRKGGTESRAEFTHILHTLISEDRLVTGTALYAHLLDQLQWELLTGREILPAGESLLEFMGLGPKETDESGSKSEGETVPEAESLRTMIFLYQERLVERIEREELASPAGGKR